jgi:hypothetical protein
MRSGVPSHRLYEEVDSESTFCQRICVLIGDS